jgi:ATP-dependent DNA helicase RecQ
MTTIDSSTSPTAPQFQILTPEAQYRADRLRAWRKAEAQKMEIRPFRIFGDRTLNDLANKNPDSIEELGCIFGMGTQRVSGFGGKILRELTSIEADLRKNVAL